MNVQAQAVSNGGLAGINGRIDKRDGKARSNVGEAAIDAVETTVSGAPGSRAAGRFTGDERSDVREGRAETVTVSLPSNTPFLLQFVRGA
jgi:hypothetical protein